MNTKMKTALMTVSVLAIAFAIAPAHANPNVMCSIKSSYQGGVSVDGKPVVPADLNAAPAQSVRIPLTIDLAQRMNEILPEGMKLETQTGLVDILGNGHVLFNGKDLTGPANVLCSKISKEKETALKTKDAPKAPKKVKHRAADVPADVNAQIKAQPVEPVAAETVPAEPAAAPTPAPEPVAVPAPQQPQPVPAPQPEPQVLQPVPAEPVVVPAPEMPPQPAEILSPTEGGMVPRPPTEDPFAPPPAPAPAPDEMLSGGGQ